MTDTYHYSILTKQQAEVDLAYCREMLVKGRDVEKYTREAKKLKAMLNTMEKLEAE